MDTLVSVGAIAKLLIRADELGPGLAGGKCFVDYCGQTVAIVSTATGEVRDAQAFVGVLGASNYT